MPPRPRCPENYRYAAWLAEKRDEYEEGDNRFAIYKKAYASIIAYDKPILDPKDALKVKFIGPQISSYLASRAKEESTGGATTGSSSTAGGSKKRGRPKTTIQDSPPKRPKVTPNSIPAPAQPPPPPPTDVFRFWYLDECGVRVRSNRESFIEFEGHLPGHAIEILPGDGHQMVQHLFRIKPHGERIHGLLPMNHADNYPVSTLPLDTLSPTLASPHSLYSHESSGSPSRTLQPPAQPPPQQRSRTLAALLQEEDHIRRKGGNTLDPSRQATTLPSWNPKTGSSSLANVSRQTPQTAPLVRSQSVCIPSSSQNAPSKSLERSQTMNALPIPPLPPPAAQRAGPARTIARNPTNRPRLSNPIPNLPAADLPTEPDNYISIHGAQFPPFESDIVPANAYTIVLLLDNRERTDGMYEKLWSQGIQVEQKALALGDVLWIARLNSPNGRGDLNEVVLDAVLERKRLDDLCNSIKDGRFHEQKFRLHQSGINRVFYVVEEYDSERNRLGFEQSIATAISSTQVVDGFMVKETRNMADTVKFYVAIHRQICELYANKPLCVIPSAIIRRHSYLDQLKHLRRTQPSHSYLTTYKTYDYLNSKSGFTTVQTTFAKMLLCINGVSAEKAGVLTERFQTPRELYDFLVQAEKDEIHAREEERLNPPQKGPRQKKAKSQVVEAKFALQDFGSGGRRIGPALSDKIYQLVRAKNYEG